MLDTHILLWWLSGGAKLSKAVHSAITNAEVVYVSAATAWEIGIKASLGKLTFHGDLSQQMVTNDFQALNITIAHAEASAKFPQHHQDPFDRILIGQASLESLVLVTADRQIKSYDIPVLLN